MSRIKGGLSRVSTPVIACTAIVAVLGVTAAVAAPKFVTGKKVTTTITKKVNANQLRVTGARTPGGTFDPNSSTSLMAQMNVPQGPVLLQSTFTLRKDTGGLTVTCKLRLPGGKGEDTLAFFGGGGQIQVPGALSVAGNVKPSGPGELRCYDGSAGVDSAVTDIELTVTKVPRVTLQTIP